MTPAVHLNSPHRCCATCVFRSEHPLHPHVPERDYCKRHLRLTFQALETCGLNDWRAIPPKPPRRSLRRWLWETLFA